MILSEFFEYDWRCIYVQLLCFSKPYFDRAREDPLAECSPAPMTAYDQWRPKGVRFIVRLCTVVLLKDNNMNAIEVSKRQLWSS